MTYGYDDSQDYFDSCDQAMFPSAASQICCERHPGEVVSNGRFDAPCGACESEAEAAHREALPFPGNPFADALAAARADYEVAVAEKAAAISL